MRYIFDTYLRKQQFFSGANWLEFFPNLIFPLFFIPLTVLSFFDSFTFNCHILKALYIGVIDFVRLFICLNITMTYISVLCMFGDETTTQFERVHKQVCECQWNELSLDVQKFFPMILMAVEKPAHLRGFMSVKLTREFMKAVSIFKCEFSSV